MDYNRAIANVDEVYDRYRKQIADIPGAGAPRYAQNNGPLNVAPLNATTTKNGMYRSASQN